MGLLVYHRFFTNQAARGTLVKFLIGHNTQRFIYN